MRSRETGNRYVTNHRLHMKKHVPKPFKMNVRTYTAEQLDEVRQSAIVDYVNGNWTAFINFQESTMRNRLGKGKDEWKFRIFAVRMIDEDDVDWRRILRNYKSITLEIYDPELSD